MAVVVSLGSISADFLVRTAAPPSGPGTVEAWDLLRTSGGKAGNVATLAVCLGHQAVLLGCVGDDDLAELALAGPRAAGVDLRVRRRPGPTGYASIVVPPDGEKTILRTPNANERWGDDAGAVVDDVAGTPAGSVLVLDLELPGELVAAALDAAAGRAVVLDPAPPDRMREEWYACADHLTPDASEAAALSGMDVDGEEAGMRVALALQERTGGAVHVKLAGGGCALAWDGGRRVLRAPEVDVVDQTGAGDAYAGGLAAALLDGADVVDAARLAVAASTCAVTAYGSQEAQPGRDRWLDTAAQVEVVDRF